MPVVPPVIQDENGRAGGPDFRSDTVTLPTPLMRDAMAAAEVGDDVFGEDPTVNELESRAASRLGKEAGLFVLSGTMGNLAAILTHARRGDEAIAGDDSHIFLWEAGGLASVGGVVPCPLPTDEPGRMDLASIEAKVRPDDPHLPRSRLILVENTYGARNGSPLPPDYFDAIAALASRHGLATHMDGARLFNAAVALEVEASRLVRHIDSVSVCLSKGLGAPIGSVLCGRRAFIAAARRVRKALGGGMRQAGIVAAAGLVALDTMIERLADDHAHARSLALGLAALPGLRLHPAEVRTNIIFFDLEDTVPFTAADLARRLEAGTGVRVGVEGPRTLRAVTHHGLGLPEVDALLDGLRRLLPS
ncbi:MAG: GntG family PLP-dependent aldolase [Acidobacteriota bacterium]